MIKKKMICWLLTIFFLIITLSSCGESEIKYTEIGLGNDNESDVESTYSFPLLLGIKFENGYTVSKDIEIYYGVNPKLNHFGDIVFDGLFEKYSDYNQTINYRIVRKISVLSGDFVDVKEIYSINVSLGDFLTKDEYVFDKEKMIKDSIDYTYLKDKFGEGEILILYYAEFKTLNDEYIKYVLTPKYFDEDLDVYVSDESRSFSPFFPDADYREIKSIDSKYIHLGVKLDANSFSLSRFIL